MGRAGSRAGEERVRVKDHNGKVSRASYGCEGVVLFVCTFSVRWSTRVNQQAG